MLAELREDNGELVKRMRHAHEMIDEQKDVATASLLEVFIDETGTARLVLVRGEPPYTRTVMMIRPVQYAGSGHDDRYRGSSVRVCDTTPAPRILSGSRQERPYRTALDPNVVIRFK